MALLGALLPVALGSMLGVLPHDVPLEPRVAAVVAPASALVLLAAWMQRPTRRGWHLLVLTVPLAHLALPTTRWLASLDAVLLTFTVLIVPLGAFLRHLLHPGPARTRIVGAALLFTFALGPSLLVAWSLGSALVEPAAYRLLRAGMTRPSGGEAITLLTRDGLTLRGTYWAGRGPPVVLVHGLGDSRVGIAPWIEALRERGIAVLAYDQRAHGESDGVMVTYADREPEDLCIAVERLASLAACPPSEVLPVGVSMGGGAVLAALPALSELGVRRAALLAPASDYDALVRGLVATALQPFATATLLRVAHALGAMSPMEMVPRTALGEAPEVEVLALHGTLDTMVPPRLTERMAREHPNLTVHWLEGDGHVLPADDATVDEVLAWAGR